MINQTQQAKSLRDVKGLAHGGLPGNIFAVGRWSLAAKKLTRNVLPAEGEDSPKADQGIFIAPYQILAFLSMRATTSNPEFHVQPSS